MADYTLGIVAHTSRIVMVNNLIERLDKHCIDPEVSTDDGRLGCLGNHAAIHGRLADEPGWSVILEDDALPVNDFGCDLEWMLDHAPHCIVSLYLGTGYPANWQQPIKKALEADTSWIVAPRLLHAVGYAIAPEVKGALARFLSSGPRLEAPDDAISLWARQQDIPVAYTNPSLVDHLDVTPALSHRPGNFSTGRKKPRKAHNIRQRLTWGDNSVIMTR